MAVGSAVSRWLLAAIVCLSLCTRGALGCSAHDQCNADQYCDSATNCYECAGCSTYDDAIDGTCPSKCQGSTPWIQIQKPAQGDEIDAASGTLSIEWTVNDDGGSLPTALTLYLMRPGQLKSLAVLKQNVAASDNAFSWAIPDAMKSGTFWIAITGYGQGRPVGSGPGDEGTYLHTSQVFTINRAGCTAQSDCTGYCDQDNECAACSQCQIHLNALGGTCPAHCGGTTLNEGQTVPNDSEENVVGPVRNFLRLGCGRFNDLVDATDDDIVFDDATLTSFPSKMTKRLDSRLATLADLVLANGFGQGVKLRVLRAYETAPQDLSAAETHHEGRGADLTLTGSPSSADLGRLASLAVGAKLDWVHFVAATQDEAAHVHVSVIPDACQSPIDLIFLLDGSGSIDNEVYGGTVGTFNNRMLEFIKSVVNFFEIGDDQTRVGVATFANSVTTNFQLKDHKTKDAVLSAIDNIGYPEGGTRTRLGLETVRESMFTAANGMRGDKEGISRVLVVITDGQATPSYEPKDEAEKLHEMNVNVFAVGVGVNSQTQLNELNDMASDPDDKHTYNLKSFNAIQDIVESMSATTCDAPTIVDTGTDVTLQVASCETKYFKPQCGAVANVFVEVTTVTGQVDVYVSKTDTHPGPFSFDEKATGTDLVKRIKIEREVGESGTLYVAVVGVADGNSQFTLSVNSDIFDGVAAADVAFKEDTPVDTTIFTPPSVSNLATQSFSPNLRYAISEGNDAGIFRISETTGVITLAKAMDREAAGGAKHVLRVMATDQNLSCLTGVIVVTVDVLDVNDNLPTFFGLPPYNADVDESAEPGTEVVTIKATDADGLTITYSLEEKGGRRRRRADLPFAIDPESGVVTTTAPLDFETQSQFDMVVTATDAGSPPTAATADLSVTIVMALCTGATWSVTGSFPCATHVACQPGEFEQAPGTATADRDCQPITDCDYNTQFRTAAATATSNTQCDDLTVCDTVTQVVLVEKTETADRECGNAPCPAGQWSANGKYPGCAAHSVCGTDQYQKTDGSATADRDCQPVQQCDFATQFRSRDATPTSNAICTDLTVCGGALPDETVAATETTDRQCGDTSCSAGQWSASGKQPCTPWTVCDEVTQVESAEPSETQDRECAAAPCPQGFWSISGVHPCQPHKTCAEVLETLVTAGTQTADAECQPTPCESGTFSASGNKPCAPHRTCELPAAVLLTAGSSTTNAQCAAAPCPVGSWSPSGAYPCATHKECDAATEVESVAPSATNNRECAAKPCPDGEWSAAGTVPCTKHKTCNAVTEVVAATGSATTDTDCAPAPCPAGQWSVTGQFPNCAPHTVCDPELERVSSAPSATEDRECERIPCAAGSWSETGLAPCRPHKSCEAPAEVLATPGTATADTACDPAPCVGGTTFSASGTWPCEPCKVDCGNGGFITVPCGRQVQLVCSPYVVECKPGEYESTPRTASNDRVCQPISECVGDEVETKAPTSTSDRVCEAVDNCAGEPCKNGGVCVDGEGTFTCRCVDDWLGVTCEVWNSCAIGPCGPGVTCTNTVAGAICGDGSDTCDNGKRCACCDVEIGEPCPVGDTSVCITADQAQAAAAAETTAAGPGQTANSSAGLIGGIIAAVLFLMILIILAFLFVRRRDRGSEDLEVLPLVVDPAAFVKPTALGQGQFNRVIAFDHLLTTRQLLSQSDGQIFTGYKILTLPLPVEEEMPSLRKDCRVLLDGVAKPEGAGQELDDARAAEAVGFIGAAVPDWLLELAINHVMQGKSEDEPLYEAVGGPTQRNLYEYEAPVGLAEDLGLYEEPAKALNDGREYAQCDDKVGYGLASPGQETVYDMAQRGGNEASMMAHSPLNPRYSRAHANEEPTYQMANAGGMDESATDTYHMAQADGEEETYTMASATSAGHGADFDPVYDTAAAGAGGDAEPTYDTANATGAGGRGRDSAAGEPTYDTATNGGAAGARDPIYDTATIGGQADLSTQGRRATKGHRDPIYDTANGAGAVRVISMVDPVYDFGQNVEAGPESSSDPVYATGNIAAAESNADPVYDFARLMPGYEEAETSSAAGEGPEYADAAKGRPVSHISGMPAEASATDDVPGVGYDPSELDTMQRFGKDYAIAKAMAAKSTDPTYSQANRDADSRAGTFIGRGGGGLPASVLGSLNGSMTKFPTDEEMRRFEEFDQGAALYDQAGTVPAPADPNYDVADTTAGKTGSYGAPPRGVPQDSAGIKEPTYDSAAVDEGHTTLDMSLSDGENEYMEANVPDTPGPTYDVGDAPSAAGAAAEYDNNPAAAPPQRRSSLL